MPAATAIETYPLSPLQQGMLSHHPGGTAGGVDLVQIIVTLPEHLPAGAFEQAWHWLTRRHAILRTGFVGLNADAPVQEVQAGVRPEIAWHDWQNTAADVRLEWWTQLLQRDRARGFDLATPPLWRVTVVRTAPRLHRVILTFHHLLLDARAVIVLWRELFAACDCLQAGRELQMEPPVPYRSYIDWLQARDPAASAGFWREALAGFRSPTPLPAPASAGLSTAPAPGGPCDRHLALPAGQTATLRSFAAAHGITLNTLVQGAWALLLGRYTGEDDVVFGAVRACRHGSVASAGELVGLLINTLPLRVALPPEVHVVDWLRALRQKWIDLRPHEHVPLSAIRPWCGVPASSPLFETIVSYQEPGWDEVLRAGGGVWSHREFEVRNQINHPLALDAAGGAVLQLRIFFDPARFTAAVVERMLGHMATLLAGMAAHPQWPLRRLPLLPPAEQRRLREDWNRAPSDFQDQLCVHHLFEQQADLSPEALAVADDHRRVTYRELDQQAAMLARRLLLLGCGPNVLIGVCVDPSVELVVALLAVLKAGGAYVPMDPAYPAERLAFMVRDAGMPVLLTTNRHAPLFASTSVRILRLDAASDPADSARGAAPAALPSPGDLAYMIYTSGSTGRPKGVPIRHRSVVNLITWHQRTYEVMPADRATQLASPAFDACVWELWPYLTAGASIHVPANEVRLSPARLVRWLAARQITLCFLPTPLAEAALDESWPPGMRLRFILTGGDRLRRWPGRCLPCPLVNHYGPTESTVVATSATVPPEPDGHAAPAIGRPIANTELYVLDRHRQLVPVGVPGELHLGGAGLADGYHRRPELTGEKFVPSPFRAGGSEKLYRTGDLVRWREDGQLEYLGRIDQQVKIRGHRIEPGEIEALLHEQPALRESLVICRDDATGQPQLVAYYLVRPGSTPPTPAALAQSLHQRLPAYMVPVAFVALTAWPLTAHGKIDRDALPAPIISPASGRRAAPGPGVESAVARVWSEVLGRTDLGADDDFFQLGGHSLRAAQVVSRLNAALHTRLTVSHLFEHSTIAALAAVIKPQLAPEPAPAELVPHG